jgi:hypothetical protein
MIDETSRYESPLPNLNSALKLGYLIDDTEATPYSMVLQDLTNLFVIGNRALDVYYNLLIQLCDDYSLPLVVLTARKSEGYENQICEKSFWQIDLAIDQITHNLLDLGNQPHPSRQIGCLVNILSQFCPLSSSAKNLLHVVLWKTFFSHQTPTLQALQGVLAEFRHHDGVYEELCQLLSALPWQNLSKNYDNLSLSRIQKLPTILSSQHTKLDQLHINLLLWKLLSLMENSLPPLFLLDVPSIEPTLMNWLCLRYSKMSGLLVVFDSGGSFNYPNPEYIHNLILTQPEIINQGLVHQEFCKKELRQFQEHDDVIAIKLRNEPTMKFITIF